MLWRSCRELHDCSLDVDLRFILGARVLARRDSDVDCRCFLGIVPHSDGPPLQRAGYGPGRINFRQLFTRWFTALID